MRIADHWCCNMQFITRTLFLTAFIAGHFCQKLIFDNSTLISPCTSGAKSGIDKYFISGTIGENITELLAHNWQIAVFIQILRKKSSRFIPVCRLIISGATCTPASPAECKCIYNTATDMAHFSLSDTVNTEDSNAIMNAYWQHQNGTTVHSRNFTLQEIYEVNTANLTLTISGVSETLDTPETCSFSLTLNRSNHLELCCSNMAMPCYPQIVFKGTVLANNMSPCVDYKSASDGVTGNLILSYSVCSKTDYASPGNYCTVEIGTDEVTLIPSTSSTAAHATSTITSTSKAPVTTTPRTTTLPFLWTTDMRYDQSDQKNLLTIFWPGLIISGLGFVLVLVCVVLDVVSNGTSENNPTVESYTAVNEGEIIEKNVESKGVHEEIDSDTLKERDISSRMSETEV